MELMLCCIVSLRHPGKISLANTLIKKNPEFSLLRRLLVIWYRFSFVFVFFFSVCYSMYFAFLYKIPGHSYPGINKFQEIRSPRLSLPIWLDGKIRDIYWCMHVTRTEQSGIVPYRIKVGRYAGMKSAINWYNRYLITSIINQKLIMGSSNAKSCNSLCIFGASNTQYP